MGLLAADYRPPVRRGDLAGLRGARTVVIIDGEFGQSLSVSPKEVLSLIDEGTRVIGASSMGALRAAELHTLGMRGIGWVFDSYRCGRITGDDEVALAYLPTPDFTPVTVPLVNVRYWLDRLRIRGLVNGARQSALYRRARSIFFAERTPERLRGQLAALAGSDYDLWLEAEPLEKNDIKSIDARTALTQVAQEEGAENGNNQEGGRHEEAAGGQGSRQGRNEGGNDGGNEGAQEGAGQGRRSGKEERKAAGGGRSRSDGAHRTRPHRRAIPRAVVRGS